MCIFSLKMAGGYRNKFSVNVKPLADWLESNAPMAVEKLAVKARVSASLIYNASNGKVPTLALQRWAVARAIGVSEEVLFPPIEAVAKKQA